MSDSIISWNEYDLFGGGINRVIADAETGETYARGSQSLRIATTLSPDERFWYGGLGGASIFEVSTATEQFTRSINLDGLYFQPAPEGSNINGNAVPAIKISNLLRTACSHDNRYLYATASHLYRISKYSNGTISQDILAEYALYRINRETWQVEQKLSLSRWNSAQNRDATGDLGWPIQGWFVPSPDGQTLIGFVYNYLEALDAAATSDRPPSPIVFYFVVLDARTFAHIKTIPQPAILGASYVFDVVGPDLYSVGENNKIEIYDATSLNFKRILNFAPTASVLNVKSDVDGEHVFFSSQTSANGGVNLVQIYSNKLSKVTQTRSVSYESALTAEVCSAPRRKRTFGALSTATGDLVITNEKLFRKNQFGTDFLESELQPSVLWSDFTNAEAQPLQTISYERDAAFAQEPESQRWFLLSQDARNSDENATFSFGNWILRRRDGGAAGQWRILNYNVFNSEYSFGDICILRGGVIGAIAIHKPTRNLVFRSLATSAQSPTQEKIIATLDAVEPFRILSRQAEGSIQLLVFNQDASLMWSSNTLGRSWTQVRPASEPTD